MKGIKKFLFFSILLLSSFFGEKVLGADGLQVHVYNGDSAGGYTGSGNNSSCNYKAYPLCRWKLISNHPQGIRVSFVYYDGVNYTQLGNYIDIWYGRMYNGESLYYSDYSSGTKTKRTTEWKQGGYRYLKNPKLISKISSGNGVFSQALEDYFNNQDVMEEFAVMLTGHSLTDLSPEGFGLENEVADPTGKKPAQKGYRFLIEPVRGLKTIDDKYYVMTMTEIARENIEWAPTQYKYYDTEEERLFTKFDDIGISATMAVAEVCNTIYGTDNNKFLLKKYNISTCQTMLKKDANGNFGPFPCSCRAEKMANAKIGHALQIIDFSRFIEKTCDYNTGEGFPTADKSASDLTDEEKKCCDDKIAEIKKTYNLGYEYTRTCVLHATGIEGNAACLKDYFNRIIPQDANYESAKKAFEELSQKYPACWNCDIEKMELVYNKFTNCVMSKPISNLILSILTGDYDSCFVTYRNDMKDYYDRHPECPPGEPYDPDCPYEQCPPTIDKGCDEDNPNDFPSSCDGNNKECCIEFENTMKKEFYAIGREQGLKGEQLTAFVIQNIQNWYQEEGKEFRQNCLCQKCNINDPVLTKACCDELRESYPELPNEFWIGKGCEPPIEEKCTWIEYNVTGIDQMEDGNCSNGTSLKISDSNNWECIFESDSIKEGSTTEQFKDYYLKFSNPYCTVYCREDVNYNFPDDKLLVKAGHHFQVSSIESLANWSPVQFISTRECKSAGPMKNKAMGIDTEQFVKDWEAANNLVIATWDQWKIAEQQSWAYANATQGALDCDKRCTKTETTTEERDCNCRKDKDGNETCDTCEEDITVCVEEQYFGYTMTPASVSYASYGESSKDITPGTWCSSEGHADPDTATKEQAYKQAVENMSTIESDILSCASWDQFNSYQYTTFDHNDVKAKRYSKYDNYTEFYNYNEFSPDLTIEYNEPTYSAYNYNDLLSKTEEPKLGTNNFNSSLVTRNDRYLCVDKASPDKSTCQKVVAFTYSTQKAVEAQYIKQVGYQLKEGVFNVILKPQGIAVYGSEKGTDSDQYYIDLGYSALHVHFMTPTGKYPIGLSYNGLTPFEQKNKFKHNFDQFIGNQQNKYSCTYNVHNEIIENDDPDCEGDNCEACKKDACDPETLKGLNLIYRPISLSSPFPGIDGSGRTPGSNWNNDDLISRFILNNRGVLGDRIYYDKKPMYEITLTPALIKEIRNYNQQSNYNDFYMDCNSEGKECKSKFLRESIGSYNFSNHFKGCGILNWNDCDNEDHIERNSN